MDFLVTLAAGDPLSHVLDVWIVDGIFSKHMLFLAIAAGLMVWLMPLVARRIAADGTGGRLGGFFECILVYLRDEMSRPFLGKEGDEFLPIIWTFFFLILFSNILGLIPMSATATANAAVTAGLALCSFVIYHSIGIKRNGFLKYLKANLLVGPWPLWPLMIPIEIAGHIIKPVALTVRLAANMVAGHIMLAVIVGFGVAGLHIAVISTGAGIALTFLELLVAMIQAYVFTFLTTVFLSMAVHPEH